MEVKPVKKLISLLLALVILCGSAANAAPIAAAAERPENVYQTEEEAVAKICEYLMARTETFTVSLASTSGDGKALSQRLMQAAMAHTGDPRQGDFLTWQMRGWSASITTWQIGSTYEHKIAIQVQFYTTAAQEAALDKAVADVLLQLDLGAKSDYEKIRGVYDYICDNVVYDHANLNDGDYYLKYTAYAALVNKTSVCQGYACGFCNICKSRNSCIAVRLSNNNKLVIYDIGSCPFCDQIRLFELIHLFLSRTEENIARSPLLYLGKKRAGAVRIYDDIRIRMLRLICSLEFRHYIAE
jgi:hypothetical protein